MRARARRMGRGMSAARADGRGSGGDSSPKRRSPQSGTKNLGTAVHAAMEQFRELTGRTPEAVTGARPLENGDGWSVLVDVVELDRIPTSTSVLAIYRVDLDPEGSITSYERLRRYTRGATDPT
jgi:hypothetical protein